MSVSAAHRLTSETLSLVLKSLSLHDLTSASLVSKSWQAVVFPHLYHTVCITLACHLEQFANRIASDKDGSLSLRTHIRGLIFDQNSAKINSDVGEPVVEDDLEHLAALLPDLTRLEHFSWELPYAPRNSEVLEALQANPNLKSIHWMLNEEENNMLDESFDDYVKLLEFKNLSRFALTISQIPLEYDEDSIEPLVNLLRSCPDLEYLSLDLRDQDDAGYTWSPDALFNALDSPTFPSLHTFRALGSCTPNWIDFFDSPDSSPLRTFLFGHPKLHTLSLGWVSECAYNQDINPDDMAALLPSLKYLEAPAFFCAPVLASSLASQLERVTVLDAVYDGSGPNLETIAEGAASLPKLRKLSLPALRSSEIEVVPLRKLLSLAPGLEEFEIGPPLDEPDQFLEVLKLIPNLRELGLDNDMVRSLKKELGVPTWEGCIPALAQNCPLLRCINNRLDPRDDDLYWLIKREADGQVTFTHSDTR